MKIPLLLLAAGLVVGVARVLVVGLAPARRRLLERLHASLLLAPLAMLLVAFGVADLSYAYVHAHTTDATPLVYRIAGLWGGEEGTILLWAAVGAATLLALRREDPLHDRARTFIVLGTTALAFVALLAGVFRATDADALARAPRGIGLADVLLTPLMVVHPPIQFVAYGLLLVPAGFAIAQAVGGARGDRTWCAPALAYARVAWLVATLGLGLGALWAYYVLSFGGYWAWDPVETGNLLPWLALTAFLHAAKHEQRHGDFPLAAPILAVGSLAATLFATFSTRSGLWASVHAFTDPTERYQPEASLRLLAILDAHLPTRAFLGMLTALVLVSVALLLVHEAKALRRAGQRAARAHAAVLVGLGGFALLDPAAAYGGLFALGGAALPLPWGVALLLLTLIGAPVTLLYLAREDPRAPGVDVRTLMKAAVALFLVAIAVAFVLDWQVVNGPDRRIFDRRAPFLALPIVAAMTVMLALGPLGRRGALALSGVGLAGGAAGAVLFPDARVLALALPPLLAALIAAALKLAHVQGASAPRPLRVAGGLLLGSAIAGAIFWSNPPSRLAGWTVPEAAAVPLALAGLALATVAFLGSIAAFRARGRPLALAGAVAGALLGGYGVGFVAGLLGAALVLWHRAAFADAKGPEPVRVREGAIYMIHLAVVVALLGYAASTYEAEREVVTAAMLGSASGVGDRALRLGDVATLETKDGGIAVAEVALDVEGAGTLPLRFEWRAGRYDGLLVVHRGLLEDVYVVPRAFHTEAGGWVGAGAASPLRAPVGEIDRVSYTASVLPGMPFVWGGAALLVLGMALVVFARAAERRANALRDPPGRTKRS